MSSTVIHPGSIQTKRLKGSTVLSVIAGLVLAAVVGYGIANTGETAATQNEAALSALRNEAGDATARVGNPALAADALRNEAFVYSGFPRTDPHWSNQSDVVNGLPLTVLPRIDDHWSNKADVINGMPIESNAATTVRRYGPMHMTYSDLVAFEGAGQSAFPRTDEQWSNKADVINGMPVETQEESNEGLGDAGKRPLLVK